jgi:hypothetical protein
MMGKINEKNVETGQQGTNEPWKKPGQASQDPSVTPPKREDREREHRDNQTS